jgi:hypothetical protein
MELWRMPQRHGFHGLKIREIRETYPLFIKCPDNAIAK